MNLDYAGDLSPSETWIKIKENVDCFLVDCRTSAEWSLVSVLCQPRVRSGDL